MKYRLIIRNENRVRFRFRLRLIIRVIIRLIIRVIIRLIVRVITRLIFRDIIKYEYLLYTNAYPTFEEFINKIDIDNIAMSNIKIDISRDITLTLIEILMRDQTPVNIKDSNFNIIVNIHPTDGTHWVLVISRRGGKFITLIWC